MWRSTLTLPLLQLKLGFLERQYLFPWEIGTYFYQPCVWYYMPVQLIVILATTYTTLVVIMAKHKLVLHILGGAVILLHSLIYGSRGAMFANSNFGIAQSLCIGLYRPTSFGILAWQACNVPMLRNGHQSLTPMCYVPHHPTSGVLSQPIPKPSPIFCKINYQIALPNVPTKIDVFSTPLIRNAHEKITYIMVLKIIRCI